MTDDEIRDAYGDDPAKVAGMRRLVEDGWHRAALMAAWRPPLMDCCKRAPWDCECPHVDEECGHTVIGQGSCGPCNG